MGTPNVRDLLVMPGRLSYGATNLLTAWPHGGVGLGLTKGIHVRLGPHIAYPDGMTTAEEFGGEVVEGVQQGESVVVTGTLHSWDKDALGTLFPNTAAGGVTQRKLITAPGTVRAGAKLSDRAVVLVYTPDDVDHLPVLVLHRALPSIDGAVLLNLALDSEAEIGVAFYGIRNAANKVHSFGMRKDITL